jgi:hypothetical protein
MTTPVASLAEDVADYLETLTLGTVGRSIFKNNAPENGTDFVLVSDTGGEAPTQDYAIDHPGFQVAIYARAKSFSTGWTLAMACFDALNRKQNIAIGSHDCMYIQAVAAPQIVPGLDAHGRWLITCNFRTKVRRS